MARPQMLFLGNKGQISYEGIGNVQTGTGQKGSIALWFHPSAAEPRNAMVIVGVDSENGLTLRRYKQNYIWRVDSGGSYRQIETPNSAVTWRHVVATWDFTGGPGSGVMRLYIDGVEAPESPVTTASAPIGPPAVIQFGPTTADTLTSEYAVYDQCAIWDDTLAAAEVAALFGQGRLHVPAEGDGSGSLLFRASWDGQYDAEVAEGSGTMTVECDADEYCRLDVGSREHGKRFAYQIGTPRHDGSEDDRIPLYAVIQKSTKGAVAATNTAEWGELAINASGQELPVGAYLAPWLAAPTQPMNLRISAHVVADGAPVNLPIGLGALSYFHGNGVRYTASEGCTASKIYANQFLEPDGYWTGAEVSVITGAARGQRLRALTNSAGERSLTVEGEFSEALPGGSVGIAEFPKRVEPHQDWGGQYRLECNFSQIHDEVERFSTLECAIGGGRGYFCVDSGRVQHYADVVYQGTVFFGKREVAIYPDWQCTLLIERIEMDGPTLCQSTEKLDDTFMVVDPETGESPKVWLASQTERVTSTPVQYSDPAAVQAEFTEVGTWREELQAFPSWMEYDRTEKCLRAPIVGVDGEGVGRIGYIVGTWNDATGRVEWVDDPDPRNPMFTLSDLQEQLGGKGSLYNRFEFLNGVFQTPDGTWSMLFVADPGLPDGMVSNVLSGAADRYSFDPALHFHPDDNPIRPFVGGRDKVVPEGGGIGFFGNCDCEHRFVENRYETDWAKRFWGYARTKTELHHGDMYHLQPGRPLSCVVTSDFKNLRNMPWRNTALVPHYGWFHYPHPEWYSASTVGIVVDDGGVTNSHVNLYVADDGVNFQKLSGQALVANYTAPFNANYMAPASVPVQMGDQRLYWYRGAKSGLNFSMATIRLDGEAVYALEAGATSGDVLTCELRRPAGGWSELKLNVDPHGGTVLVAVVDAATEETVSGHGLWDCDEITEGTAHRVTWDGTGLSELAIEAIRLKFRMTRTDAANASPELCAWRALAPTAEDRPWCQTPEVEGEMNPTRVADTTPELTWEYGDAEERPQSAFHVLVASTDELVAQHMGDLWDSGVVYSAATGVTYDGLELGSETTYFWKVRVRNSEGVWSEEW